jgi:hypothetical protein
MIGDDDSANDGENNSPGDDDEDEDGDGDDYFIEESIMHIEGEIMELKSMVLNMMTSAKAMSNRFEKSLNRAVARGKIIKRRNNVNRK